MNSLRGSENKMKSEYRGYKPGDRIELIYMEDSQAVPEGTKGTIKYIDDIGQLHMSWDNGRSLAVNLDVDKVRKLC